MKKSHIVIIIMTAVCAAILVSFFTTNVPSSTFTQAKEQPGKNVKITGTFDKSKGLIYDERKDPNLTIFHMLDADGLSHEVKLHYSKGKPMGLDQSETVTIHGKIADDGSFQAHDIQLKCPSKYNEKKHELAAGS